MKKIIIVSPKNRTVYNFRGELIREIISRGYEVIVTGPDLLEVEKIEALGARFVVVPLKKNGVSFVRDYKYYKNLKKLFKEEKPEIVFSYTVKPVIYGSIAAKKAKVSHICSMITGVGYTFIAKSFKARVLKFLVSILYKFSLKKSDCVIFQNPDDLHDFVKLKLVSKDKCSLVNGSGVDMGKFVPTPYPKKLTFFMLSRVLYSKGVEEFLKAAKIIKQSYDETRFILLGAIESMQDSIPKDVIDKYVEEGIIDYYGETSDVRDFYSQSSVFVLPSYREGTPRTVLEAMAMKRPIISTNTPGCKETVINGKNGFLVTVKDVDSLVESMEYFVSNLESIKIMGEESYKLCKDKFDVNKVNQNMLQDLRVK